MQLRLLGFGIGYLPSDVGFELLIRNLVSLLWPRQVVNNFGDFGLFEIQVEVLSDPSQVTVGQFLLALEIHQLEHFPSALFSVVMSLSQRKITILSVIPTMKSSK